MAEPAVYAAFFILAALTLGGAIAAPMAALLTRRIPTRTLMILVGVLIIALSLRTILSMVL